MQNYTVEFEYDLQGIMLNVTAKFYGEYSPATGILGHTVCQPAESPELEDIEVVTCDESGDEYDFDASDIYVLKRMNDQSYSGAVWPNSPVMKRGGYFHRLESLQSILEDIAGDKLNEQEK